MMCVESQRRRPLWLGLEVIPRRLELWSLNSNMDLKWELVKNSESQMPGQTYRVRIGHFDKTPR